MMITEQRIKHYKKIMDGKSSHGLPTLFFNPHQSKEFADWFIEQDRRTPVLEIMRPTIEAYIDEWDSRSGECLVCGHEFCTSTKSRGSKRFCTDICRSMFKRISKKAKEGTPEFNELVKKYMEKPSTKKRSFGLLGIWRQTAEKLRQENLVVSLEKTIEDLNNENSELKEKMMEVTEVEQ